MDTKFTLLNTRVIISHIYQKEIDMAIHYMKKYDYNHNLVFRAIIKANNIVLLRKVVNDNLLYFNEIKKKSFETIIIQKNKEALIFLFRLLPENFDFDIRNLFLLSCKKNAFDLVDTILTNKSNLISDEVIFEGILYVYFLKQKNKEYLSNYLKDYLRNKSVFVDFNIYYFKTFIPYLKKYNIFSYEGLLSSIYVNYTDYLEFILDNKNKINFSFTDNNNKLLKRAMQVDNLNFTKMLLNEKEVLNSKTIIKDIKRISFIKNNESIELAHKIICLNKF
tara:strand:- start:4530 stop:5363 length:834 start_codon:yes stop_codon:yes gene_type:complete